MFQHILGKLGQGPYVPEDRTKSNQIVGTSPINLVQEVGGILPIKTKIDTLDDVIQALGYKKEYEVVGRGEQAVVTSIETHSKKEVVLRIKRKFVNNEHSTLGSFVENHNILKTIYLHGGKVPKSIAVGAIKDSSNIMYPFQIQEKIGEGINLSDILNTFKILPPELAITYALEITGTTRMIDLSGYIHRDLKPANILCDENGHPFISDFGLKREKTNPITSDVRVGTPDYMAPEYFNKEANFLITDRHAISVMLYEMCIGRKPFTPIYSPLELLRMSKLPQNVAQHKVVKDIYFNAKQGNYKKVAPEIIQRGGSEKLASSLDAFFEKSFKKRHNSIFELHSDISRLYLNFAHDYKERIDERKKEAYSKTLEIVKSQNIDKKDPRYKSGQRYAAKNRPRESTKPEEGSQPFKIAPTVILKRTRKYY